MVNSKMSFYHTIIFIKRNLITLLSVFCGKKWCHYKKDFCSEYNYTRETKFVYVKHDWKTKIEKVTCLDYLDTFYSYINSVVDDINIVFMSDLKDVTFFHSMNQQRSMLCRKLERIFYFEDFGDFNYSWLPNCFRNMNK